MIYFSSRDSFTVSPPPRKWRRSGDGTHILPVGSDHLSRNFTCMARHTRCFIYSFPAPTPILAASLPTGNRSQVDKPGYRLRFTPFYHKLGFLIASMLRSVLFAKANDTHLKGFVHFLVPAIVFFLILFLFKRVNKVISISLYQSRTISLGSALTLPPSGGWRWYVSIYQSVTALSVASAPSSFAFCSSPTLEHDVLHFTLAS